jgi:hypothetical protein
MGTGQGKEREVSLGGEPGGVAREERRLADVAETEVEHHHTLQTHATTGVRRRAVLEGVDVGLGVDGRIVLVVDERSLTFKAQEEEEEEMRTWMVGMLTPFSLAFSSSMAESWIRWAPEQISSVRMNKSYELE